MPGIARNQILYDGCTFHLVWRCHNRGWYFKRQWVKGLYYDLLYKYMNDHSMKFYSYHFMENHIHLIGRLDSLEGFSCFFRVVNNLFARRVNKRLKRSGQVVMDRPKTVRIDDDRHLLSAMSYSDLNGVRAGRDSLPEDSKWSSYRFYAHGRPDALITPAPSYLALSESPEQRMIEYRALIKAMMALDN
jgi:REP-associated tyrosine transposase